MKTTYLTKSVQPVTLLFLGVFVASSITALASDSSPDLPGIVAWWRAEGNALDSVGQNHGILRVGTSFSTGIEGQCFGFDGASGYIDVSNTPSMDFGSGDFTIAGWLRFASLATGPQEIFHKVVGTVPNDQTYFLEKNDGVALRFMVRQSAANQNDLSVAAPLEVGVWYHVCAVRTGNTNRIFLNGSLLGEQVAGNQVNTGTGGSARIGRIEINGIPGLTRFFNGNMDELCLYNRALTPSEIRQLVSPPLVSISVVQGSQLKLCWTSRSNWLYQVEFRSDLLTNGWNSLGAPVLATNSSTCVDDVSMVGQPQGFYRVVKLP